MFHVWYLFKCRFLLCFVSISVASDFGIGISVILVGIVGIGVVLLYLLLCCVLLLILV